VNCLLCSHSRTAHEHYTTSRHCSVRTELGWCRCGQFEHPLWSRLQRLWPGPVRHRCTAEGAEAALINVLLFGRFANPTQLPQYLPERRPQILARVPRRNPQPLRAVVRPIHPVRNPSRRRNLGGTS
jgi:hypothetical protein